MLRKGVRIVKTVHLYTIGSVPPTNNNREARQGLSQDFETGCLKLAVVKCLGVQIFKGGHNYSYFNHKHV